jgi:prolyl-tRNA editing enzyme YbaK/EbsC (Cys-tRNA(Pro) deacylase)
VKFMGRETQAFPSGTRTAQDAATSIGCGVGQIAKSLLLRRDSGEPLLVVASGSNTVDLAKVAVLAGEPVAMADARWVRDVTGFAIGGVPPAGHARPIDTLLDVDLLRHDEIWAAAGTPRDVFRVTPAELLELTGGTPAVVAAAGDVNPGRS